MWFFFSLNIYGFIKSQPKKKIALGFMKTKCGFTVVLTPSLFKNIFLAFSLKIQSPPPLAVAATVVSHQQSPLFYSFFSSLSLSLYRFCFFVFLNFSRSIMDYFASVLNYEHQLKRHPTFFIIIFSTKRKEKGTKRERKWKRKVGNHSSSISYQNLITAYKPYSPPIRPKFPLFFSFWIDIRVIKAY